MHIRARIKGASHRRWRSLSWKWKSFIKQAVYEKEIRNRILRVVLYVGSETAWHCLYCKMQRKKLGWARVCVTVWECVDRLSEKSSNYDELAGYWFLDEFLSCLASIMSVIHAAPHGTPRTGPGGGCEKVSSTKKCSPTLLSLKSLFENSTLSSKAQ